MGDFASMAEFRRWQAQKTEANLRWLKPGVVVQYHPVMGNAETDGHVYEVEALGTTSDRHPVAWLKGKSGYVHVAALSRVP